MLPATKGASVGEKIRIFLIEENRLLRQGLMTVIKKQPDLSLVAAVENGADHLSRARQLRPHVVLSDRNLRVVEALRKKIPDARVVLMDLLPTQDDVIEFVKAGARGFILKDATVEEFLQTIRLVARGQRVLPPPLTDSLFSQIERGAAKSTAPEPGESFRLTGREREVVELIGLGLSNKEIAGRLHIAVYTVKSHVHNILEKLALRSRLEISNFAHTRLNHRTTGTA